MASTPLPPPAAAGRPPPVAIAAIKSVHTAVFLVELGAIGWLVWSGLLGRRDRSVALAAAAVGAEAAVFLANDHVCPLTPMAEQLGAARGSVSDIFLPEPVARTIPAWSTALVLLAVVLHARSAFRVRRIGAPGRGQSGAVLIGS